MENAPLSTQLRLLAGGDRTPEWSLDERTRLVGRRGVAEASGDLAARAAARTTDRVRAQSQLSHLARGSDARPRSVRPGRPQRRLRVVPPERRRDRRPEPGRATFPSPRTTSTRAPEPPAGARSRPSPRPRLATPRSLPTPRRCRVRSNAEASSTCSRADEVERVRVVGRRVPGQVGKRAIGLVDDNQVGELDDPALDPLQLVARARREQQHEHVDHSRDRDLGLADADRLDEHDVEAGGLAHQHRLAGAARHPAERAARR